ncbi:MAG: hypothetical protein IPJ32_10600 [Sphingobacteriaceae bacterium]|nr:hypothetical protein [Sphingobacteriaceae bacterium]
MVNFRGFYANSYFPYGLPSYYYYSGRYSEGYFFKFDTKPYKFQTPGIGVGYVLSRHALFIKTDFNYWYGTKNLNDDFSFRSDDKNTKDPYQSFPVLTASGQLQGSDDPVGHRYYRIKDHYSGSINIHYFDIGFAITGNITRFLRMYSGWRINWMMKYSYKGKIDREASLYEVKKYVSQYERIDSLIQVENLEYKNKEVEAKSVQELSSFIFYNFGLNANFRIKKQLFFVDLIYETNRFLPAQQGTLVKSVTFKLAYVFKYSTDIGD